MNAIEKFDAAVQSYLSDAKYRGVSDITYGNYKRRLALFREFWTANCDTQKDPSANEVKAWRNALLDGGCKPSTVTQYLMELRYFFNYACDKEIYTAGEPYKTNPVNQRLAPKVQKKPYDNLMDDEAVAMLWDKKNYCSIKNYAIIILLLCTKMRNKELIALTMNDLDFESEEIYIRHGKGDKFRIVEFDSMAQSAVKMYLESKCRPKGLPDDAPLFGNTSEKGVFGGSYSGKSEWHSYTSAGLSTLVERQVRMITGVPNIRTHDLRHIGSRIALNSRTVSLEELQAELGHSSMNTTQIYSGRLVLGKRNKESVQRLLEEKRLQTEQNEQYLERIGKRG